MTHDANSKPEKPKFNHFGYAFLKSPPANESELIKLLDRYPQYGLNKYKLAEDIRHIAIETVKEAMEKYDGYSAKFTLRESIIKVLANL